MKQKETTSNIQAEEHDDIAEQHVGTSYDTPLRPDAFEQDDELKIELISKHFKEIMHVLGLDLEDDSLSGTPRRVAKCMCKRYLLV